MSNIKAKLQTLLDSPGVYLFFDAQKELVYVGKATSLKSRVKSYFSGQKSPRPIEEMIHEVTDIKWLVTDSVLEAVLLEGLYIKKYRPKYNIQWRDDKSWNYITLSKDTYPKIKTLRERELKQLADPDKMYSNIFGPFPHLNTAATLKILRRIFHYSTCEPFQKRPCLYYQMHQCFGVCTGEISAKDYKKIVIKPLTLFLSGKKQQLIKTLTKEMLLASKQNKFEEAKRLRDQIYSLQKIQDVALLNKNFVESYQAQTEEKIKRIEGYDISNISGVEAVGSMVVFENEQSAKNEYRKFKIKTVQGTNDTAMLREILTRRLNHFEWTLPDIILIDGGKPQVNTAKKVLAEFNLQIPLIGLAKGAERKKNEIVNASSFTQEKLFKILPILINVRDEAHRFAIGYHRKLRAKKFLS